MIISILLGFSVLFQPKTPQIVADLPRTEVLLVQTTIASSTPTEALKSSPRASTKKVYKSKYAGEHNELIKAKDWNSEIAIAVMICESGGVATKHNYSDATRDDSYGLFQVNLYGKLKDSRPSPEELKDAETNIDFAYKIYQQAGWNAWKNCYNKVIQ